MRTPALSRMWLGTMLLVLGALIVAGCGGGSGSGTGSDATGAALKAGGTLDISQAGEVIVLDPPEIIDPSGINVISQINESLFKVNAEEELEPWLASSYEKSADQTVWTLQLRKGVEFSTGQPLTSADVLFTLEAVRKSPVLGHQFEKVEDVQAPSPSTIVIKTKLPAPELPAELSLWGTGIVPDNYGDVSKKEFAQHPVGTGPFMFGPWKRGESITLEKNPGYWQSGQPFLDKVVVHTVASPESRVAQLKGGQLDVIDSPPWSQIEGIEATPGLAVGDYPLGNSHFLILNSHNPLFQDERVREAIALAIDREGIVSASLNGHGEPSGAWLPPVVPYSDHAIEPLAQDSAKAKQLLAEAVKDGVDPSFTMNTVAEDSIWGTAGQVIQQNLEEVGFDVEIRPLDLASDLEALEGGDFDAGGLWVYSGIPSPLELVGYYDASKAIYSGASTTETAKLSEQAGSEVDSQKRERLYHQFQEIIAKERFLVPIQYAPFSWATRDAVSGFAVGKTGIPWLAETGLSE